MAFNGDRLACICKAQLFGPYEQVDAIAGLHSGERLSWNGYPCCAERDDGLAVDPVKASAQHIYIANEGRDKPVGGAAVDFVRRTDLANATLEHDGDPIRQAQGFALIVGYEDRGNAELALDLLDFNLHRCAQIPVERRKRLVEQQYLRRDDKRASQRHTLLLTARELVRAGDLPRR